MDPQNTEAWGLAQMVHAHNRVCVFSFLIFPGEWSDAESSVRAGSYRVLGWYPLAVNAD